MSDRERYRTIFDTLAVTILEHDFSDVKRALDELRVSGVKDVRRYIAEHPEFVHELRRRTRITDINQTGLELFGVARKQDFFQHLSDFLPESDDSFLNCIIAIDEDHPVFTSESRMRTSAGRVIPTMFAIRFPPGHDFTHIYASVLDVTERFELQEEVEQTRSELERARRVASLGELTASIAHEVKQPLAAIMSSLQAGQRWLARDPADLEELRSAMGVAVSAAKQAAMVLNRVRGLLSDASSVKRPIPVDVTILDAVRFMRREAENRAVLIKLDLRAGDEQVLGDRILIKQVIVNLVMNSLQAMDLVAGPRKSVSISSVAEEHRVVIDVTDTGPGFGEQTSRVFKAFDTTKRGGVGLGLAISRYTVESHGGVIALVPRPSGHGACVRMTLPLLSAAKL